MIFLHWKSAFKKSFDNAFFVENSKFFCFCLHIVHFNDIIKAGLNGFYIIVKLKGAGT